MWDLKKEKNVLLGKIAFWNIKYLECYIEIDDVTF